METSIYVIYLYYILYHTYISMYEYGFKYTHMHVDFFIIPPPYLLVQVLHEGGGMGALLIGVRYRCREMVLGGALGMISLKGMKYK